MTSTTTSTATAPSATPHQHGVKGVYYGGHWLDIEDCPGKFLVEESTCSGGAISPPSSSKNDPCASCPRSASRNACHTTNNKNNDHNNNTITTYDIVIIGAGCIGAAIARACSQYQWRILWLEAADDVSQGATKGNSGIVHAGYDDTPHTNRAKYCWTGNQMFPPLDKELRFGYQQNGSLVVACNDQEVQHLYELQARGVVNGVQRLQVITDIEQLRRMEPYLHPNVKAALYSPDAGNVIPYEYTIALAENAVDNGVELRIRRKVTQLEYHQEDQVWTVTSEHWEPSDYVQATNSSKESSSNNNNNNHSSSTSWLLYSSVATAGLAIVLPFISSSSPMWYYGVLATLGVAMLVLFVHLRPSLLLSSKKSDPIVTRNTPLSKWVQACPPPKGGGQDNDQQQAVSVSQMLVGGSGAKDVMHGVTVATETIRAKYVINCAGGAADQIARLIEDDSFTIQPRLGDYLLLNRNQVGELYIYLYI
jgi:glycine/D-amino acid oxidase-like deaminating enzyme